MRHISFTEFRKNASSLISEVEAGTVIRLVRHGKPIAEIKPVDSDEVILPSWKKPGLRLALRGISLSDAIIEERESS